MTTASADGGTKTDRQILQVSKLKAVSDNSPIAGAVILVRKEDNLQGTFNTTQLDPHSAYTIWWQINANPDKCKTDPCKGPDLFNAETGTSAFYGGGFVTGSDGTANVSFSLDSGPLPEGYDAMKFGTNVVPGLPKGAGFRVQLKIIIKKTGPVDAATADVQLGKYNVCSTCVEQEFAVFEVPK